MDSRSARNLQTQLGGDFEKEDSPSSVLSAHLDSLAILIGCSSTNRGGTHCFTQEVRATTRSVGSAIRLHWATR
jgi:hypothetical protein